MKKDKGFWASLEKYLGKVLERSPLPQHWRWMAIGLVIVVVVNSVVSAKYSVVGVRDMAEVIKLSAERGDYATARDLYDGCTVSGCQGVTALEDIVYPERKVERRIEELEAKLLDYPGNREIYHILADLSDQLGREERASEYREKARILDPNL